MFFSVLCSQGEKYITQTFYRPLTLFFPSFLVLCPVDQLTLLSFSGTSLVALVVPVSIGMFVNHKWPRQAKIILKVSDPCYSCTVYCSTVEPIGLSIYAMVFSLYYKPNLSGTSIDIISHAVHSSRMSFPTLSTEQAFIHPLE